MYPWSPNLQTSWIPRCRICAGDELFFHSRGRTELTLRRHKPASGSARRPGSRSNLGLGGAYTQSMKPLLLANGRGWWVRLLMSGLAAAVFGGCAAHGSVVLDPGAPVVVSPQGKVLLYRRGPFRLRVNAVSSFRTVPWPAPARGCSEYNIAYRLAPIWSVDKHNRSADNETNTPNPSC
jgi:hypothetical protein